MTSTSQFDALIIGGGFYGSAIAIYLASIRGLRRVLLIDKESALLTRASYSNQARVHNGYHYPRSFTTAFRSRINLPKFVYDWPQVIRRDFIKLYAIARINSKVTSRQFERFCCEIGASLSPAPTSLKALFEPRLIEDVFVAEEYAFDTTLLAEWAEKTLREYGVSVQFKAKAIAIDKDSDCNSLRVTLKKDVGESTITCRYVFNCTYSGLNQLFGDFRGTQSQIKQEITEMALIRMPPALKKIGITVMDGPFFSTMPFPARDLHTLSHVRYTPHYHWHDERGDDPYERLKLYERHTRVDRMMRDVARYLPSIKGAEYIDSLFEIKTVLVKNEGDDGRPILFEKHPELPGCYSVLGGKIDNIYDVFEKLDMEKFSVEQEMQ